MSKQVVNRQPEDIKEKVQQIFADYLEQHGLRKTPERFAIFNRRAFRCRTFVYSPEKQEVPRK
jgi:hypothetical protein